MLGMEGTFLVLDKQPQQDKQDKQVEQLVILKYINLLVLRVFDYQEFH